MGFPTLTASQGLAESSSASGNRNITVPTLGNGDLLMSILSSDGAPTFSGTAVTNMTSLVARAVQATNAMAGQCFYRICDGSESGATWVLNLSTSEACCWMWLLVPAGTWHGTSPPEAAAWNNVDTQNPDPPNLTPSWGAGDTLWAAAECHDNGPVTISSYPTNYPDDNFTIAGNISSTRIAVATRQLNAASENPGTFALSASEDVLATTIAIRGTASGAPPDVIRSRLMPQLLAQ